MTVFVNDIHEAIKDYESKGFANILYSVVSPLGGSQPSPYAMMDTREELGVLTEFYEEAVVGDFYKMVKEASENWDGSDPIRYIYGQP